MDFQVLWSRSWGHKIGQNWNIENHHRLWVHTVVTSIIWRHHQTSMLINMDILVNSPGSNMILIQGLLWSRQLWGLPSSDGYFLNKKGHHNRSVACGKPLRCVVVARMSINLMALISCVEATSPFLVIKSFVQYSKFQDISPYVSYPLLFAFALTATSWSSFVSPRPRRSHFPICG